MRFGFFLAWIICGIYLLPQSHTVGEFIVLIFASAFLGWLLLIVALVVLSPLYIIYEKYFKEKIGKRKKCPHGVRGGLEMQACPTCLKEIQKQKARIEAAQIESAKKERFRSASESRKILEKRRYFDIQSKRIDFLRALPPNEFEDAIARLYRKLGYRVEQTPYTNDGGKDAIMFRDGETVLLECKRYGERNTVGRPDLQKFYAAMIENKAKKGYFVTTGKVSKQAMQYSLSTDIHVVDEEELLSLLESAYGEYDDGLFNLLCSECGGEVIFHMSEKAETKLCPNKHLVRNDLFDPEYMKPYDRSKCPKCGRRLKARVGKYGPFIGCTGYYMGCKFTQDVRSQN